MVKFAMENAWLIPLLPAISFAIIGLVTLRSPKISSFISIALMLTSFVLAILVNIGIFSDPKYITEPLEYGVRWLSMPGLNVEMGVRLDPTSGMMLFVVSLVASLVQIYSLGYMHGDPGFSRFFAYLSLFAASMLGLVIAKNLLQMFIFWELVGLCSYLLIGYFYYKVSAREAAKKAFMTTRVGDTGLLFGILFLQIIFGTLDFTELTKLVPDYVAANGVGLLTIVAVLIFIGPIGKSGQFPLHVWLPDAMEGPTPVSALIHAATMVVAGVYMVGRTLFIFDATPTAAEIVAWTGAFTAIFAASIAITQVELKKILAYSTVSQLGYMMLALGVGSLAGSMFHLMTHAFFKALMFLAVGSVLHAVHGKLSIWDMGGLKKKMPITAGTMIIGGLAIAGIPPFAGFFSKDEILVLARYESFGLYLVASVTALMTAFYMWRMIWVTFFGPENPENHPHESPLSMTLPLIILAFLSIVGGWVGTPWTPDNWNFFYWLSLGEYHQLKAYWSVIIPSVISAVIGIGGAYYIYIAGAKEKRAEKLANRFRPLHTLSYNKYYIDELYLWINHTIVDGVGKILYWVDIHIIDGIVDGLGFITKTSGGVLRYAHTGRLQNYALIIFAAIVIIVLYMQFGSPAGQMLGYLGGGR
ncbi:MAG: NADH-quinone oxidoreductase subunit L [Thermincolia bacterium]